MKLKFRACLCNIEMMNRVEILCLLIVIAKVRKLFVFSFLRSGKFPQRKLWSWKNIFSPKVTWHCTFPRNETKISIETRIVIISPTGTLSAWCRWIHGRSHSSQNTFTKMFVNRISYGASLTAAAAADMATNPLGNWHHPATINIVGIVTIKLSTHHDDWLLQ